MRRNDLRRSPFVTDQTIDDATDTYGYVGYTPEEVVVAYRGSSSTLNWMADLEFIEVSFNGSSKVKVHSGFYKAWRGLRPETLSYVQQALAACKTCKRIVCTGHSLGAAISGLAAIDLAATLAPFPVVMNNFGMPSTGNAAFATLFSTLVADSQRMVHERDIVPHHPPPEQNAHHTNHHQATHVEAARRLHTPPPPPACPRWCCGC